MDLPLLRNDIKALIVKELNLEGRDPTSIHDDAPLFGTPPARPDEREEVPRSLGLDSLDALQLAMSIEEKFGVRIPEGPEARSIFASAQDGPTAAANSGLCARRQIAGAFTANAMSAPESCTG